MNNTRTDINKTLFTNWHTMRWVALAIGVFFVAMAFIYADLLTGLFGGFFLFQAMTNTGCMVARSCGVPVQQNGGENETAEIEYSEVKEH